MSKENIKIRKATVADADLVTLLSVQTFTEAFWADNDPADMEQYLREEMSLPKLSAELTDEANHFALALVDDVAAGYAKFRVKRPERLDALNPLEIERIYVLCEYQKRKVGAALMDHCLAYARENGHDVVWLGVWELNHKAVKFYRQWGFEQFGDHAFRLGSDLQTDVLMKKVL